MSAGIDLQQALFAELQRLLSKGLTALDPEATPVLAELALGQHGDASNYAEAVERLLLGNALERLPQYQRCSRQQLSKGIAELLGIGHSKWTTKTERFANAATALGYASEESFRQTRHKVDGVSRPFPLILLEMVAAQLVRIAGETGFSYSGRFAAAINHQRKRDRITKPVLTSAQRVEAHHLIEPLIQELRTMREQTCQAAVEAGHVPALARLANAVLPLRRRSPLALGGPRTVVVQRVEDLLWWTICNFDPRSSDRRYAIACLFGFQGAYWYTLAERRTMADEHLRRANRAEHKKYDQDREESCIIVGLAATLAELLVQEDIAICSE